MKRHLLHNGLLLLVATAALFSAVVPAQAQEPPTPSPGPAGNKPNILFIMGDDIGMWNIGAYHRGMMAGRTPNLDKLAKQGMLFTDYYAEASCTAGRANFIMGELPIRTGMTTVGQAGAKIGIPAEACTLATILKAQGYETGQFGKNHLGDLNKFLPCVSVANRSKCPEWVIGNPSLGMFNVTYITKNVSQAANRNLLPEVLLRL